MLQPAAPPESSSFLSVRRICTLRLPPLTESTSTQYVVFLLRSMPAPAAVNVLIPVASVLGLFNAIHELPGWLPELLQIWTLYTGWVADLLSSISTSTLVSR